MRHPQTDVQQKTRVVSALNGHQRRSDLTLVSKVSPAVVGGDLSGGCPIGSRGGDCGGPDAFLGGKGTSPTEDSPTAQNMTMIH